MYDHYMLTLSAEDAYFYSIERREKKRKISDALKTLPREDRRLIERTFWSNETVSEIANEMDVSPSEVEERLKAIYAVLKDLLREE